MSPPKRPHQLCSPPNPTWRSTPSVKRACVKVTTPLHLLPRSGMGGIIPPFSSHTLMACTAATLSSIHSNTLLRKTAGPQALIRPELQTYISGSANGFLCRSQLVIANSGLPFEISTLPAALSHFSSSGMGPGLPCPPDLPYFKCTYTECGICGERIRYSEAFQVGFKLEKEAG
jgi:hypothetical protein